MGAERQVIAVSLRELVAVDAEITAPKFGRGASLEAAVKIVGSKKASENHNCWDVGSSSPNARDTLQPMPHNQSQHPIHGGMQRPEGHFEMLGDTEGHLHNVCYLCFYSFFSIFSLTW